jgi:tetratricopeptide (TPR) repeat protein
VAAFPSASHKTPQKFTNQRGDFVVSGRNALCVANFVSAMAPEQRPAPPGAEAHYRPVRPERGISEFERLTREHPDNVGAAEVRANQLVAAAEAAAAARRFSEALACFSVVANWRESRNDRAGAERLRVSIDRLERIHLEAQLGLTDDPKHTDRSKASSTLATKTPSASGSDMRFHALQARMYVARGDAVGAAPHLTAEMAEGDPSLMMAIAEIQMRGGQLDRGIALIERAVTQDLSVGDDAVLIGIELAERQPDAGFLLVDMVADVWARRSEWSRAISAFEAFIGEQPDYASALERLRDLEAAASGPPDDARVVPFRRLPVAQSKSA